MTSWNFDYNNVFEDIGKRTLEARIEFKEFFDLMLIASQNY
jgi:hypothetical protein